jgi:phospholipase/lecithinase/hemolysin
MLDPLGLENKMLSRRVIVCGLLVFTFCPANVAEAVTFTELICFGDSLTDTGNMNYMSLGIAPGAGYWQGRFSNGPTWVEDLAGRLGLPAPAADRPPGGGTNYATGGAKTDQTYTFLIGYYGMDTQVARFGNDVGSSWDGSSALVTVWGGANDYIDNIGTPSTVPAYNLKDRIDELHTIGARNFLCCNLPPLGQTPRYRGTANEANADARSVEFNAAFAAIVDQLRIDYTDSTFYYLDVHSYFQDILANPGAYGLTNVTDEAMSVPGANVDEYLFWDDLHPTRAAHALLGQTAHGVVPEPATMGLMALGALALLRCRRRRK